ncbi:hypothetical protein HC762_01845 [bacterium]|nr:hypothetical protein [bacterium]
MLAIFAPVLLATYLSSTLVLGHHHHWYDVCFGALIGIVMAVWAYKMVFVSLWDGRTNCESLFREDGKAKRKEKDDDVVSGQPNGSGSANASAGGAVLPMTRQDVNAANASGHM